MTIRDVLQLGNPLLREVAQRVDDPSSPGVAAVVADLQETLAHWRATTTYGRGIAAPQIGVLRRIVFMNVDHPWPLINPVITEHSPETMVVWDACLSFLSIFFQVTRYTWVTVRYQDMTGAWHDRHAAGDLAELLQHEIDHLDGILAVDRMTDLRTLCTREEFERRYRADSPYAHGQEAAVGTNEASRRRVTEENSTARNARMIIVQNHYIAASGDHERVLATRREANACRERLGLRAGSILVRIRGTESAPDVIWQITYPDIAAWEADLAVLEASPEFTAIRQKQSAQLRHFARCAFVLDGDEVYPLANETVPTIT